MTETLVITQCVCGEKDAEVLGRKDDRTVGRCKGCNLIRTLERSEDYGKLYTEGDKYHIERDGHIPYRERYDHDYGIAALRWPKLMHTFKLLDVGCANGAFVKYAKTVMGVQAFGLELNPHMAEWARERTGCTIYTDWHEIPYKTRFHVITWHDVFEHAVDPGYELQRVGQYLFRGGKLLLDVPDGGYEEFVKAPMVSHHQKPREHLWYWDELNLTKLLNRYGFSVEQVDHPIPGKLVVYARRSWSRAELLEDW